MNLPFEIGRELVKRAARDLTPDEEIEVETGKGQFIPNMFPAYSDPATSLMSSKDWAGRLGMLLGGIPGAAVGAGVGSLAGGAIGGSQSDAELGGIAGAGLGGLAGGALGRWLLRKNKEMTNKNILDVMRRSKGGRQVSVRDYETDEATKQRMLRGAIMTAGATGG